MTLLDLLRIQYYVLFLFSFGAEPIVPATARVKFILFHTIVFQLKAKQCWMKIETVDTNGISYSRFMRIVRLPGKMRELKQKWNMYYWFDSMKHKRAAVLLSFIYQRKIYTKFSISPQNIATLIAKVRLCHGRAPSLQWRHETSLSININIHLWFCNLSTESFIVPK